MKIADLPYYVKFVFSCGDIALTTSDINQLAYIKRARTLDRVYGLNIGDRIVFEPENEKVYRITNISIQHLLDDTKDMLIGFDSEDSPLQGAPKEWLMKVVVTMGLE